MVITFMNIYQNKYNPIFLSAALLRISSLILRSLFIISDKQIKWTNIFGKDILIYVYVIMYYVRINKFSLEIHIFAIKMG